MKHTIGPWQSTEFEREFLITAAGDKVHVAEVRTYRQLEGKAPDAEDRANVAAMTAAPELLAVCEQVLALFPVGQAYTPKGWGDVREQLQTAIAKAKGQHHGA